MIQVAMDCASGAEFNPSSGGGSVIPPSKLSPYSDIVAFRFVDQVLYAPRFLLDKFPKISAKACAQKEIDMSDTSGATGHVIVNYLYTNKYEDLDTTLGSHDALHNSLQVYAAATKYQLAELRQEAQEAIEIHTEDVNAAEALAALKKACPLPDASDTWLRAYTQKLAGAAYIDVASFLGSDIMAAEHAERTISITEMILRATISSAEKKAEQAEQAAREEAAREEAAREAADILAALREERDGLEAKLRVRGKLMKKDRLRLIDLQCQLDPEPLESVAVYNKPEVEPSSETNDPKTVHSYVF